MIKFKEKSFSKSKKIVLKKIGDYIKDHPLIPISSVTATVSTANFINNKKKNKKEDEYRKQQLDMMSSVVDKISNQKSSPSLKIKKRK